jgi:hypothetical protein
MDGAQPFIKQMQDRIPSSGDVKASLTENVKGIGENMNEMRDNFKSSMSEFSDKSSQSFSDASKEFLDSNSLLAKFSFIILVVIIFMVLLKVFMSILAFYLLPPSNPYIVHGSLGGNDRVVVPQDPAKDNSVQISKSNDRSRGVEFTWGVWLFLSETVKKDMTNIFVKGDENFDGSYNITNGPGLYLVSTADISSNIYELEVRMDVIGANGPSIIKIDNIPIQKWIHVAIRLQNTVLDVYVNGTLAKRENMKSAPKQNFNDVVIGANGGFPGKLSNLRYYAHALNVFEINNIVMFGPNITPSVLSVDAKGKSGSYSFLSNLWYSSKY